MADSIFDTLNELLKTTNIDDVTAENRFGGFERLPDGCYKCEVKKAELKSTRGDPATGREPEPMVSLQLQVIEDGISVGDHDKFGAPILTTLSGTKNRYVFKNYVLRDARNLKSMVSDMLKFEDEPGHAILDKSYFTDSDTISKVLSVIEGLYIWVQLYSTPRRGADTSEGLNETNSSQWCNLLSMKQATDMGLENE